MTRFSAVSALALVSAAGPAWAELDAATTWQDWQSVLGSDVVISSGESEITDTAVVLTDVVFSLDEGRDDYVLTVASVSITETTEGGPALAIDGAVDLVITTERDGEDDVVRFDGMIEGFEARIDDDVWLDVTATLPRFTGQISEVIEEGDPIEASGDALIENFALRVYDDGSQSGQRQITFATSADVFRNRFSMRDAGEFAVADWEMDLGTFLVDVSFDGPAELFWEELPDTGMLETSARIAFAPSSFLFRSETQDDVSFSFDNTFTMAFDGISFEHALSTPMDISGFFDGQDLIPDEFVGFVDYAVEGLEMVVENDISMRFFDEPSENYTRFALFPTFASGRIEIDEGGDYLTRADASTSMEFSFVDGTETTEYQTRVDYAVGDLVYSAASTMPLDNAMMAVMQGIPDGTEFRVSYALDEMSFDFFERSPWSSVGFEATDGTLSGLVAETSMADRVFDLALSIDRASGGLRPLELDRVAGDMTGASFDMRMPLASGATSAPYDMNIRLDSLVFDDAAWDMVDPQALLPRDELSIATNISGQMRANLSPLALVSFGMGMSPFTFETVSFETFAQGLGARIDGFGGFVVEDAIANGTVPVGTASFSGSGLEQLIETVGQLAFASPEEIEEALFLLNAFTVLGEGTNRTMSVEINDQEHLIINGQRMQ